MLQHVYALTLQNVEDAKPADVPGGASNVEDDSLTREEVVELVIALMSNRLNDRTNSPPLWSDPHGAFRRSRKILVSIARRPKGLQAWQRVDAVAENHQLQKKLTSTNKTTDIDTIFIGNFKFFKILKKSNNLNLDLFC